MPPHRVVFDVRFEVFVPGRVQFPGDMGYAFSILSHDLYSFDLSPSRTAYS